MRGRVVCRSSVRGRGLQIGATCSDGGDFRLTLPVRTPESSPRGSDRGPARRRDPAWLRDLGPFPLRASVGLADLRPHWGEAPGPGARGGVGNRGAGRATLGPSGQTLGLQVPWLGGGVTPGAGGKATSPCLSGAFREALALAFRGVTAAPGTGRAEWTHRGRPVEGTVPPRAPATRQHSQKAPVCVQTTVPTPESEAVGTQGICLQDCPLRPLQGAGGELGASSRCGQARATSQRYVTRLWLAGHPTPELPKRRCRAPS